MNRIDRLTGTLLMFSRHRTLSAKEIAAHWEISVRTVFRDLSALEDIGVPLYSDNGRYGLVKGASAYPVFLSKNEALALAVSAETTLEIADIGLRQSIHSAMAKIESALPSDSMDAVSDLRKSIAVWFAANKPQRDLKYQAVQEAVLQKKCLLLKYITGGEGKPMERMVEPLGLTYYASNWHLIAFCRKRKDFRDFRMDRIQKLSETGEHFQRPASFSLKNYLQQEIERCDLHEATLLVGRKAIDRFERELMGTIVAKESTAEGSWKVTFLTYSLDWLVFWLLGFGAWIKVLEPFSLRRRIRDEAAQIYELHRDLK